MTFLTPGNLIFSSQNPNSTFHFRSQVKIGFLLLKFRFFTPRNLIFSSQNPKSKSDFFFSNFDFSLQEIWFFQLFTPRIRKAKSKSDLFPFSREPKFRFFTPRNLIFSSQNPKSKSDFIFSNFDFSLQEIWFFQLFTPRIRKVKSKSDFSSSQNPNFDFPLQEIWFFLLRTQSQNRIFPSQISTFHSKKSDIFSFLL